MKLVVSGSRDFEESNDHYAKLFIEATLTGLLVRAMTGPPRVDLGWFSLYEGGCPTGADRIAREWLTAQSVTNLGIALPDGWIVAGRTFRPEWNKFGRPGANHIRDREMMDALQEGDPKERRLVIAFVNKPKEESVGTNNFIELAHDEGVPYLVTRYYK